MIDDDWFIITKPAPNGAGFNSRKRSLQFMTASVRVAVNSRRVAAIHGVRKRPSFGLFLAALAFPSAAYRFSRNAKNIELASATAAAIISNGAPRRISSGRPRRGARVLYFFKNLFRNDDRFALFPSPHDFANS